jgi:hypothetical protein
MQAWSLSLLVPRVTDRAADPFPGIGETVPTTGWRGQAPREDPLLPLQRGGLGRLRGMGGRSCSISSPWAWKQACIPGTSCGRSLCGGLLGRCCPGLVPAGAAQLLRSDFFGCVQAHPFPLRQSSWAPDWCPHSGYPQDILRSPFSKSSWLWKSSMRAQPGNIRFSPGSTDALSIGSVPVDEMRLFGRRVTGINCREGRQARNADADLSQSWRRGRDSNPRTTCVVTRFPGGCLQPTQPPLRWNAGSL